MGGKDIKYNLNALYMSVYSLTVNFVFNKKWQVKTIFSQTMEHEICCDYEIWCDSGILVQYQEICRKLPLLCKHSVASILFIFI